MADTLGTGLLGSTPGNRNGLGDYVRKLDVAGIPSTTMGNSDFGMVSDAIALMNGGSIVPHNCCFRVIKKQVPPGIPPDQFENYWSIPNYDLSPSEAAVDYWGRIEPALPRELKENRDKIWIFLGNELDRQRWDWIGQWSLESAKLVNPDGYKIATIGVNSGEPGEKGATDLESARLAKEAWIVPGMVDYLQYCAEHPDEAAINIHEYSFTVDDIWDEYPFKVGRFQFLYQACDELRIKRPNLFIGEWGWELGDVPSTSSGIEQIEDTGRMYSRFPKIYGGIWTTGDYQGTGIENKVQRYISPLADSAVAFDPTIQPSHDLIVVPGQPPLGPVIPDKCIDLTAGTRRHILRPNPISGTQQDWITNAMQGDGADIDGQRFLCGYEGWSHLDAMAAVTFAVESGQTDSRLLLLDGDQIGSGLDLAWMQANCPFLVPYTRWYTSNPNPPLPPGNIEVKNWYLDTYPLKITQWFGARPEKYIPLGLPGHDGWDSGAVDGQVTRAIADGEVFRIGTDPQANLGIHVRILHADGWETIHAHLKSVSVVLGQKVRAGDAIGLCDSTGNSTGTHLHFFIKKRGEIYIDQLGREWPFNIHDPLVVLKPFLDDWFFANGDLGFIHMDYLARDLSGNYAWATSGVNLRDGPSSSNGILGVVDYRTMVKISGPLDGSYYPVDAVVRSDNPPPNGGGGYVYRGPTVAYADVLHQPADDWRWPAVQGLIDDVGSSVKFLSHGVGADYFSNYASKPFHIIRLFWKPGNEARSPQQVWDGTWRDQMANYVGQGAFKFEIHNEPSLPGEGNGVQWTDGSSWGDWLSEIVDIIRGVHGSNVKLYYPGESPGVPWTNQFAFTDPAWAKVHSRLDGFCLHSYTGNNSDAAGAANEIVVQIKEAQKYLRLQKPMVVSESSVNRGMNYQQKADTYMEINRQISAVSGIEAVCWYISDWFSPPADQQDHGESWYGSPMPSFYTAWST